ncbi:TraR/DksA C4-type zinc finger protein [Cryobacterium sp. SO1]|uniref:TraR/DksA family transcriptional regulator n=1 Tax=Cryobacterium sp. SO1 TaxID=1897061 RepID=UPI001023658A|nr:TraR/DksA C4-type zinc finger protein [Cryobacterium sp. SO1]RZI36014.1 RNA polymerase-binding transcription factor DksA [Cryobacterium sp. SO1]
MHAELTASLAAIDAALVRIVEGGYGVCLRRGEPIGRERLEARPAAELCIDCAREA